MQVRAKSAAKLPPNPLKGFRLQQGGKKCSYEVWSVDREGNLLELKASRTSRSVADEDRILLNQMSFTKHIVREWWS